MARNRISRGCALPSTLGPASTWAGPNVSTTPNIPLRLVAKAGQLRLSIQAHSLGHALPPGAKALACVFTAILEMIDRKQFPVGPMLAHQYMTGGTFKFTHDTPFPDHDSDVARFRPAVDAIEGISAVLKQLGVGQQLAFSSDVMMRGARQLHFEHKADDNLAAVTMACAEFLEDPHKIDDLVVFCQNNGLMTNWAVSVENFTKIDAKDLLFDNLHGCAGEASFWVDSNREFFVAFTTEINAVSHFQEIKAWLLMGQADNHLFRVTAKKPRTTAGMRPPATG